MLGDLQSPPMFGGAPPPTHVPFLVPPRALSNVFFTRSPGRRQTAFLGPPTNGAANRKLLLREATKRAQPPGGPAPGKRVAPADRVDGDEIVFVAERQMPCAIRI